MYTHIADTCVLRYRKYMFTYDNDIFVKSLRRRVIVCTKGLDT